MRFAIEPTSYAGYEARELVDTGGGLAATFLPGLGMVGVSLLHRGEELLGRTDNLPRYASEGSTLGIPLLHPWANRLGGSSYTAAGRAVELDPGSPLLHLEEHGLPIHGVAGPRLPWRLTGERATADGAVLEAELHYATPELLAVFPFPHALRQRIVLGPGGLTVTTTLSPSGETAVPVAFGIAVTGS